MNRVRTANCDVGPQHSHTFVVPNENYSHLRSGIIASVEQNAKSQLRKNLNCGRTFPNPAERARRMAAVRSATCSLLKMLETWLRTVFSLIISLRAISILLWYWARNCIIRFHTCCEAAPTAAIRQARLNKWTGRVRRATRERRHLWRLPMPALLGT
jgi:hypothetical protein